MPLRTHALLGSGSPTWVEVAEGTPLWFNSLLSPSLKHGVKPSLCFALLWNIVSRGHPSPCLNSSPSKVWAPRSTWHR